MERVVLREFFHVLDKSEKPPRIAARKRFCREAIDEANKLRRESGQPYRYFVRPVHK